MSHFEFIIPLQRDELRHSAAGEYCVEEVVPLEKLNKSIDDCIGAFGDDGCTYILDHFDTMYSVLVHFSRAEWPFLYKIFDKLILGSLNQLRYLIEPLVEEMPEEDIQKRTLNILKMNLYIFTQFHSCIHDRLDLESSTSVPDKGKGKKGKKSKFEESWWDWDEKQRLSFIALYQIIQLQINKLWDPPVADEQFINMCANCCYKALEHPTIAHVKSKPLRETLFQLLGTLIKRYSHGISCVVKIVQLLSLHEHVVSPLAHGVVMFVRELGFKSLINEIVRELMSTTESSQDTSSIRSFSNFLVEIAELEPEIMFPTTKELIKYLDQDPYSMRCCVLSIMTEILINQLSHEELDDANKEQRDLYLEMLEDHVLDVNAFVRSKVLTLWQKIVQHNAVPKCKFLFVVDMALMRVRDKSSNVCKNALSLLKSILEHNPYGIKLNKQQLINQLLVAEERLHSMERKKGFFKNMSHEKIWQFLEPEVVLFLSTINDFDLSEPEQNELTNLLRKETLEENIKIIAVLLSNRKYEQAYYLVRMIEKEFPGATELKSNMPESSDANENYYFTMLKQIFMTYKPPEEEEDQSIQADEDSPKKDAPEDNTEESTKTRPDIHVQKHLITYLLDCIEFINKLEKAISLAVLVLNNESNTEVLEAVSFLTLAYKFGVPCAEKGVQGMLKLVFRKEPGMKEAVNVAYKNLYLTVSESSNPRDKAIEEVNRISKLALSLDYGQLEALTQLIVGWIKTKELNKEFINVLWERVKLPNSDKSKQTAIVLLSMVTQECPTMAQDQLPLLITQGLNIEYNDPNDTYTAIFTCNVISNIVNCKDADGVPVRFPPEHEMFPLLTKVLKHQFIKLEGSNLFIRIAREVINIITELCTVPSAIAFELLCDLYSKMISETNTDSNDANAKQNETLFYPDESKFSNCNETQITDKEAEEKRDGAPGAKIPSVKKNVKGDTFLRFLFLVGHVAFKYAQFLENFFLEKLKKKMRKEFKSLTPSKDTSKILESSRRSLKLKQGKGEDEVVTEADLMAAADDVANDKVRNMLDTQVVSGDGPIAGFSMLILDVCRHPKKYCDPLLKCVAATALAEVMMVSSVFCSKHMQLLVTMMEKSPEESVRASLVIAFGDLLFKFPNTVEPWTRFLYARLRDETVKVRRNTLLILSHLVTNEMVKVKGQISEVALCIVDKDQEIVDLSKRFFAEISLKGNTLYNVLPDIISHLSNPDSGIVVEEKDFEIILRYIMEQIQKEKQLENLVEKLCKRIKEAVCERQWKDLAFCLSLLPWSDRSLRKLIDYAYCFCDRLLYQPVAVLFLNIVSTVTRSTKPGLKEIGAELDAIVNEVLTKGSADHLTNPDDNDLPSKTPSRNSRKTSAKTPGTRKTAKKKKKVKYVSDSDESTSDKSEDGEKEIFKPEKKTNRNCRSAVKLFD